MRRVGPVGVKHEMCAVIRQWLSANPGWHTSTAIEGIVRARFESVVARSAGSALKLQAAVQPDPRTATLRRLESARHRARREHVAGEAERAQRLAAAEQARLAAVRPGQWGLDVSDALAALIEQGTVEPDGLGRLRYRI